ncbi:hypothetical protein [Gluconobacter cerinus]
MQVSTRGYLAWVFRPICQHQFIDLKVLAHIQEHYALSNGTYAAPE